MDFLGSLLKKILEFFGGRNFLGGTLWENFFGKKIWGGFFRRNIFGSNSLFTLLKSAKVFEYEWNLCFCQDFGVMKGRKEVEF